MHFYFFVFKNISLLGNLESTKNLISLQEKRIEF